MKHNRNQKGFSVFELILVVLVLGMVAAVGYFVVNNHSLRTNGSIFNPGPGQSSEPAIANDVSKPPAVSTSSDLTNASKVLDQNDPAISNNDAKQLSNYSSNF